MTSTAGSATPSLRPRRIARAAVVTHGQPRQIGAGLARLQSVAREHGVELLYAADEAEKHDLPDPGDVSGADIAVVLGGDGTVLRALTRFLGAGIPVVGVNFGRVGFLSSMGRRDLEAGITRVFAGEYEIVELPTLEVDHPDGAGRAVNDAVVTSASLGRMIELEVAVGGEELGAPAVRRDHLLDALGLDRVQPLERRAGADVGARGDGAHVRRGALAPRAPGRDPARPDVIVWNRTPNVDAGVLVDGHRVSSLGKAERAVVRIGAERSLLATLPEATFVRPLPAELRVVAFPVTGRTKGTCHQGACLGRRRGCSLVVAALGLWVVSAANAKLGTSFALAALDTPKAHEQVVAVLRSDVDPGSACRMKLLAVAPGVSKFRALDAFLSGGGRDLGADRLLRSEAQGADSRVWDSSGRWSASDRRRGARRSGFRELARGA